MTEADDFRARVYGAYCSTQEGLAPSSIDELRGRMPYYDRLVAQHFPADRAARIVDLGCGYGNIVFAARSAGYTHVAGVDRSREQVEAAARLGIAGIEEGDLTTFLARSGPASLDAVVTFDVVEHFRRDELLPLVDAVRAALAPGGRWILHVPNGESPFVGRIRYGDFTHELAFTRGSLTQLLVASGFARVACFEDTPVPHGIKSAVRAAAWQVIRTGLRAYVMVETGDLGRGAIFTQNLLAVAHV